MADQDTENAGSSLGEELAPSDKLRSHTFSITAPNMPVCVYKCSVCGFEAYGSLKGPTVFATKIRGGREILSCNESVVKDIIV